MKVVGFNNQPRMSMPIGIQVPERMAMVHNGPGEDSFMDGSMNSKSAPKPDAFSEVSSLSTSYSAMFYTLSNLLGSCIHFYDTALQTTFWCMR